VKKILISISLFIILSLIFVYPSFYTQPPIDCLAGCTGKKGLPLTYYIVRGGGVLMHDSEGRILTPGGTAIDRKNLIIDLVFWFVISLVLVNVSIVLRNKKIKL